MIDWFRTWSKEIVIVVIIVTLVEIILPNNNTKKYVKIASGLIIMYTVMYPIFNNVLSDNSAYSFLVNSKSKTMQCLSTEHNDISYSSNNAINAIYINNLKKDISSRLMDIGYKCAKIDILIDEDSYDIKKIQIEIESKDTSKKKAYSIVKTIEHVYVSVSKKSDNTKGVIDNDDMTEIVNLLTETYGVCRENIEVK